MGTQGRNLNEGAGYDASQGNDSSQLNLGGPTFEAPIEQPITPVEGEQPVEEGYGYQGGYQAPGYDPAAAQRAAAEAARQRDEQESSDKRREKDEKIRNEELDKQRKERDESNVAQLYLPRSNVQVGNGSPDTWIKVDRKTGNIVDSSFSLHENEDFLKNLPSQYSTPEGRLKEIKEREDILEERRRRLREETPKASTLKTSENNQYRDHEEQVYDQMKQDGRLSPLKGYAHLEVNEQGRIFPKDGIWTDEAINDYSKYGESQQNTNELEDNEYSPWEEYERIASTTGPSINDAMRLNAAKQRAERETGQTYEQYQQSKNWTAPKPPKPPRKNSQQTQAQQEQEPDSVKENTVRSVVDEFFRNSFFVRNREARNKNKALWRKALKEARDEDRKLTYAEFKKQYRDEIDQEAFLDQLRPENPKGYRRINEYEQGRILREEGQTSDVEDYMERRGVGTKIKDMHKLWRLLDQTTWDMRIGFFHVGTEKIVTNKKTGESHLEWSKRVEDAIANIMDDFDMTGIDGQRTVFRLVRLYATMTIDHQGKMFNGSNDEWSLTQDEFIDICDCIHRSTVLWGHPFVAPAFLTSTRGNRKTLRGTDMFPSGVVPRVVAEAITGENSSIRYTSGPKAGEPMTADELIEAAHQEWIHRTQPTMNANLVNSTGYKPKKFKNKEGEDIEIKERNLVAQRIAIESALQAFARLDGIEANTFGSMFNIDTAEHYKLWEYEDALVEYATVTNNKYDSQAVMQRQLDKIEEHRSNTRERRNRKQVSSFEASCNLAASGIKTNALWWNLPIRISAIAERGIGNLQTFLTLKALRNVYSNAERFKVPDEVANAFYTKEGRNAIDAAYLLLEIGGPGALIDFASQTRPMTQEEAINYLHEYILQEAKTESAYKIQQLNIKLNKASQKILAGDTACKHSTMTNFLNALMISNQAIADTQRQLIEDGVIDEYAGVSLTGREMRNVFLAHNGDVSWFLSEIAGTAAGRDALIMMNANNISQFNVVSHNVNKMLRDHGIGNAAITAFLDSFAVYGINFFYTMIPFSKTITYLSLKQVERNGDITAGDFTIGGGFGVGDNFLFKNDPGFYNGLYMNLMFDAITIGKWVLVGTLLGGVIAALGFEPPDDPEDVLNVSKWKIGKNIGLGPDTDGNGSGNGIEINQAYWINDLTQFGLPIAYAFAVLSLPDDININGKNKSDIYYGLFLDSLSEQFDGNVVLDIVDCIKNWGVDAIDIDQTLKDPNHKMQFSPFFALSELGLRAFGKLVPGAPLYKAWGTSAALRGPEADMFTTNKTYDKSREWAKEVEKTDYIEDPKERLIRKYSAGNWLLAAIMNGVQMATGNADNGTGYFWHQMPTRSKTEPFALTLADTFKMDYDHLPEGSTYESYRAQRTEDLKNYILEHYSDPEEAIRDGFFIPGDIRDAALNTTFAELNALKNEFDTQCELQFEYKSEYYDAKDAYDARKNELWNWINNWFKNPDIPTWTENYRQVLSDWDKTYVHADGTPAMAFEAIFDPTIQIKWKLKGNDPTGMLPLTIVNYNDTDKVQRGWSGETEPAWESDGSTYATLQALENQPINIGRDAGSTVGDVYWGEEYNGQRLHRDDATIGERAWYAKSQTLPESLRKIDEDNCDGGIYGELGKKNPSNDENENSDNNSTDKKPWANEYGPNDKLPWKINDMKSNSGRSYSRSFYPRRSYGIGTKSNSGGNYNPKIYSTKVYNSKTYNSKVNISSRINNSRISNSRINNSRATNTKLTGTRIGSTRTSPEARQVNNDRASSIGVRTPQDARTTYLNPNFETKGSREAYKRQDI